MMRIEWDQYRVRLAEVGRSRWPAGISSKPEYTADCRYTDLDLAFFTHGTGKISLPEGWASLRPGVCVLLRPGWDFDLRQDPKDPLGVLFVHFDLLNKRNEVRPWNAPLPPVRIVPSDPRAVEAVMSHLIEETFGYSQSGYVIPSPDDPFVAASLAMFTGLLMSLDAETDPRSAMPDVTRNRFLRQVASRIHETPASPPSVATLAHEFGYSTNHFIRLFRQASGLTPQQFIIRARLQRAQQWLEETDLSVTELAHRLGYSDVFSFSKQFKQATGASPLRFRRKQRKRAGFSTPLDRRATPAQ